MSKMAEQELLDLCRCVSIEKIGLCNACDEHETRLEESTIEKVAQVFDAIDFDLDSEFYQIGRWQKFFRYFRGDLKSEVRKVLLPSVYLPDPLAFIQRWEWLKGAWDQWKEIKDNG